MADLRRGALTARGYWLGLVHVPEKRTLAVLGAGMTGLTVLFVIDLSAPSDVVIASLYVLPILLVAGMLPARAAAGVWLFAIILQLVALLLQRANLLTMSAEAVSVTCVFLILLWLRTARSGKGPFNPRVSVESVATPVASKLADQPQVLTRREREVAGLAAAGRSAKEIAQQLSIGRRTVETHLAHAYAKLGVESKVDLILKRDRLLREVKEKSGRSL